MHGGFCHRRRSAPCFRWGAGDTVRPELEHLEPLTWSFVSRRRVQRGES